MEKKECQQVKNLEIRQLQQVETVTDNIVEGYALKFDSPSENLGGFIEFIDKRALDGVDMSDVRMFVDHDSSKLLGRTKSGTLTLEVDDIGLKFRALLPDTSVGRDAMELVKRGDLSQCSFGFTVAKDEWRKADGINHRTIKQIKSLFEISLVSIPAYADTDVSVAKRSLEQIEEEAKQFQKRKLELELNLLGLYK